MSTKWQTTVALVAVLVVVFAVSVIVGGSRTDPQERFAGTDSVATATIEESHPEYTPWFQPWFRPESGEVESGLFALQAGLGGTVLGFALGALWGRRREERAALTAGAAGDVAPPGATT